jgi:DNA-binding NtrC family response regulator
VAAVLIVTSEQLVRGAVGQLEAAGHVVILAGSITDGETRLREGGIDVVVVEYEITGGIDLFAQALQRLPDPPPFVLIGASLEAPAISARLGAAAFLAKPINVDDLERAILRIAPHAPVALEDVTTSPVPRPDGN